MPPRKKARATLAQSASTPSAAKDDDAMDIDTPQGQGKSASKAAAAAAAADVLKHNECWTDDQVASLFKGVIRWKPAGMHKHFRMIAISEHLRNHGFDPDYFQHTRIPYIWHKLRTYYNLNVIDDRESFEDDDPEDRYTEFRLPMVDYYDLIMQRAVAEPREASSSPPQLDLEKQQHTQPSSSSPPKKRRRRADTTSQTRAVSREETEEVADEQSPAARSTRGSRGRARAASRSKAAKPEKEDKEEKEEKADTTEEEEEDDDDDEDEGDNSNDDEDDEEEEEEERSDEESGDSSHQEPSEEEKVVKPTKSGRGVGRRRGAASTRSRRGRRG